MRIGTSPKWVILAATKVIKRALQVALALIAFRDDFGDLVGWD